MELELKNLMEKTTTALKLQTQLEKWVMNEKRGHLNILSDASDLHNMECWLW